MRYYPKNRIKTDLYTNGKEFVNPINNKPYIGDYHKLYNGESYIGKNPSHTPRIKLISLDQTLLEDNVPKINYIIDPTLENSSTNRYYELRGIDPAQSRLIPIPYYPELTEEDYKYNFYQRYFVRKINLESYIEIDSKTYDKISNKDKNWGWELYIPFTITWIIKGNQEKVINTNRKSVIQISRIFRLIGFKSFLKEDYLKFWRP